MKARVVIVALTVVLLSAAGCAGKTVAPSGDGSGQSSAIATATQPVRGNLLDPQGDFVLYVGNGSREIDPVDIAIKVDGIPVLKQEFETDKYQTPSLPRQFSLRLAPGNHSLIARSVAGDASMETSFVVTGKHWAAVEYRYYSETHGSPPQPRSFGFRIQDEPMLFD